MKIALLFPGYGSQHIGMGKNLCEEFPIARECFEKASDYIGIDFKDLCFTESNTEVCVSAPNTEFCYPGRGPRINVISNAYLAIFVVSFRRVTKFFK